LIAKENFTLFCSPFNSALNHILDILSRRSGAEIAKLEYRPLIPRGKKLIGIKAIWAINNSAFIPLENIRKLSYKKANIC
jgi:hypothetical protein